MFSPKRCLADSNCCRRFCRPLTKPLIQGTIIKFACKGNTIIRSFQTNLVFFSFFAPTVPQQLSEGNGENGGGQMHRRASISPSIARQPRSALLVPPLSDKPDNASTMPRQCVASLVRPLWDKRRLASPPPQPRNKESFLPYSAISHVVPDGVSCAGLSSSRS